MRVRVLPDPPTAEREKHIMTTFFLSDLHLGHDAIIEKGHRPFVDTPQMDSVIIQNYLATVTNEDAVYILGDFAWKLWYYHEILPLLPGNIFFVPGNHDEKVVNVIKRHVTVLDRLVITKIEGYKHRIVLSHYPLESWYNSGHGVIHLHGHLHGGDHHGRLRRFPNRYDVGVDVHNYFPVTLDQLLDTERYERLMQNRRAFNSPAGSG
jgi:calcineurin-like phosphoesterase family protein